MAKELDFTERPRSEECGINVKRGAVVYIHRIHMGLVENSVPLHPMVLLITIPTFYGYFIGGIHHFQTYPHGP